MDPIKELKTNGDKASRKRVLNYRWLINNTPFFAFLTVLAVIYIYNGHYADKVIRDSGKAGKDLKELQYEYKTLRSEVMFRSKESELAKAVAPLGLKELLAPPAVVADSLISGQKNNGE